MNKKYEELAEIAKKASKNAYVPYSNFKVGSSVLAGSGKIYYGCNIENASYGATICAERVAIQKAVSEGEKEIKVIAVYTSDKKTYPCGICRQVMREFTKNKELVILIVSDDGITEHKIDDLLPYSFSKEDLDEV